MTDRAATAWQRAVRPLAFVCALLAACIAELRPAHAEDQAGALEARVKAAFLYKFTGYVEWPAASFPMRDTPFVIAVMGADATAGELAKLAAGRALEGHPIVVRRARAGDPLADAHVLFIGREENARLGQVIRTVPRLVLVVTEADGALDQGSVINFVISEGRVRFEVSLDSAEKQALRVSSRMLGVAMRVRPGSGS